MLLFDIIYFLAFCIFLTGAGLHLRGVKPTASLWVMVAGVLIDFFATVLPNTGFKSLAIGIGDSAPIIWGITLGVLVWTLFLVAVFIRLMERMTLFYFTIALIKVVWFIDLVLFMYGVYTL